MCFMENTILYLKALERRVIPMNYWDTVRHDRAQIGIYLGLELDFCFLPQSVGHSKGGVEGKRFVPWPIII